MDSGLGELEDDENIVIEKFILDKQKRVLIDDRFLILGWCIFEFLNENIRCYFLKFNLQSSCDFFMSVLCVL